MKRITSKDNPQYRKLKQFASNSAAARRERYAILDGVHLCQSYLEHVGHPALCVVSQTSQYHAEVLEIIAECEKGNVQCLLLPDGLFRPLSQVVNGVDIVFLVLKPVYDTLPELVQNAVLLDRIQDPGNVGSILRSAAASGIRQVYCSVGTASVWTSRVLRAGMGAHFLLEVFENVSLETLIETSKIPVVATTPYARSTIYDIDLRSSVAWLLGHEGGGISESLMERASDRVVIPHAGLMESLNVAACAAVCFFEQMRQCLSGRK